MLSIFVDMPQKSADTTRLEDFGDLRALFESSDEEGEFFGFMNASMNVLFENDNEGEFYGFQNNPPVDDLAQIFLQDTSTNSFHGF